jgi:hypothetical protein
MQSRVKHQSASSLAKFNVQWHDHRDVSPIIFELVYTKMTVHPLFKFRRNFNRSRCMWLSMWLCLSLQKIGFETAEARLAPGSTIQVYSDKATVQVYSNSTNS